MFHSSVTTIIPLLSYFSLSLSLPLSISPSSLISPSLFLPLSISPSSLFISPSLFLPLLSLPLSISLSLSSLYFFLISLSLFHRRLLRDVLTEYGIDIPQKILHYLNQLVIYPNEPREATLGDTMLHSLKPSCTGNFNPGHSR